MHEVALDLLILLAGIWLVAVTLRPLGLPTVMGELIVGVLVGPAVFGLIEPTEAITLLAEIGIFFLMFHAGIETQPLEFFNALKRSLGVAIVGAIVPFAVSFGVATLFGLGRIGATFVGLSVDTYHSPGWNSSSFEIDPRRGIMRNVWRSGAHPAVLIIALAGLLSCDAPPGPAAPGEEVLAIANVTVIPMDRERQLEGHTVLIRDGRIDTVEAADDVSIPRGATVIDGRGKFMLPSLVDAHVHVDDPGDLAVFLAHGVGAVRNLQGLPYHVFLRDEVDAARLRGPRLFTCGPYTNAPRITDAASATRAVTAQAQAGYDCIKIHGDLAAQTLVTLGQAARSAHLPLIGHVPRNLELLEVLDSGAMREISHAEEYLYTHFAHRPREMWEEAIDEAVQATKAAGLDVTPTLVTYRSIAAQVRDLDAELARLPLQWAGPHARRNFRPGNNRYQRKFETEDAGWLEENLALQKRLVLALHAAGVPLLTGTDANSPAMVPGFSLHEELALLVEIGLEPFDALQAATTHGWRRVSGRDDVGQVAVGMQAELLLLDADPLADIRNTTRIAGVVARGQWLPAAMLRQAVDEQSSRYELEQPFVDLLWDNTIDDGVAFYGKKKADDPTAFVFRAEALACQVARSIRDGAPQVAVQAIELALQEYPGHPLAERLLEELRNPAMDAD